MCEILRPGEIYPTKMQRRKLHQTYFLSLCLLFCITTIKAQQLDAKKFPVPFPIVPIIAEYEYEPYHFMQWIAGSAEYSMIEAVIGGATDASDLRIIMTEKATSKRIFYCQSEARAKDLKAAGKEAYLANIDFKQTSGAAEQLPIFGFGFRDKNNQPILWRVTPATRPSERGSGLTAQPATVVGLLLRYRKLGTAVGAGTAIQIGDKIIEAEPWTEISAPPYFVAFRGSVTDGSHVGSFPIKSEKWTVAVSPTELQTGVQWILKDDNGRQRAFKIVAQNKDELTIDEIAQNAAASLRLVVRVTSSGFSVRSLEWGSLGQKMRIVFTPELPALDASTHSSAEVAFTVAEGKNSKISSGTIFVQRHGEKLLLRLQPKSPEWAKSKAIDTLLTLGADGYAIETTQNAVAEKK